MAITKSLVCLASIALAVPACAGSFEDLGIPVRKAGFKGGLVGPDASGEMRVLYFNFNQTAAPLFLVQVNPDTGETRQFVAPKGPGAWAFIVGPDKKIYLGTWGGGYILRFDPTKPEAGIEFVGKPSATETYIWQYTIGPDGRLYGCTYPQAKLISYDPKTGEMADLGRMDDTQMYSRSVAAGDDGIIYVGIGFAMANIVAYDPKTGEHRSVLPEEYRKQGIGQVMQGKDGAAYAIAHGQYFRCRNMRLEPIDKSEFPGGPVQKLADGRILVSASNGKYTLLDPKTNERKTYTFEYEGAGSGVFVVGVGPEGKIYGSTAMPLELFVYDPKTGRSEDLGNPTPVGGEIYSLVTLDAKLYVCAYPGSWLSVYDPSKPFKYGTQPDANPRGIGRVGDGHLRPRAMIVGPDRRLYIGSLPPYGQLGGALGVYDPATDEFVENYRNLIPNQSIVTLAYEPGSDLIFGGSSIAGGGGSTPTERDAHFFAWDYKARKKTVDIVPIPGRRAITAMAAARGKVFFVVSPDVLLVYDPKRAEVIYQQELPASPQRDISLGLHTDGLLYGLAGNVIYRLNPETFELSIVAQYSGSISCGFALTDTGIYFGSGAHLVRYRW